MEGFSSAPYTCSTILYVEEVHERCVIVARKLTREMRRQETMRTNTWGGRGEVIRFWLGEVRGRRLHVRCVGVENGSEHAIHRDILSTTSCIVLF
jgi:hypothetical protein